MEETEFRTYKIPDSLLSAISNSLEELGMDLDRPQKYWQDIHSLSNFYIQNPSSQTPWKQKYAQIAYLTYYLPLNFVRASHCIDRLDQIHFFQGIETAAEFGSGNGALSLALEYRDKIFKDYCCIEKSNQAIHQHKAIQSSSNFPVQWRELSSLNSTTDKFDLLSCCYSFTELSRLPAISSKALLIIEPSTHQDARRLMEVRQKLIEDKYQIWAPCTHQGECPLLKHSSKDWCHDRVVFELPDYMKKLNSLLPFQISSLSYSYLACRKDGLPKLESNTARITGDSLDERGKRRQLVCRGEDREFLSWFRNREICPSIDRGSLVKLPDDLIQKSNELRSLSQLKVFK